MEAKQYAATLESETESVLLKQWWLGRRVVLSV